MAECKLVRVTFLTVYMFVGILLFIFFEDASSFVLLNRKEPIPACASLRTMSTDSMHKGKNFGEPTSDMESQRVVIVSEPTPVYIEDTDAYGVLYNANYLRAFDRALQAGVIASSTIPENIGIKTPLLKHLDWSIVSVRQQKFKSSPALGDQYIIVATLIETPDVGNVEVWNLVMRSPDGSTIYNTADGVVLARPGALHAALPQQIPLRGNQEVISNTTYVTFRDEYDPHLPNSLPLRSVLNLFERGRSNFLGGPTGLRRLKDEYSLLLVVTTISDCMLLLDKTEDAFIRSLPVARAQKTVTVKTVVNSKRRGMVLECRQTAFVNDVGIAQGVVDIMHLDANTRRPTNRLPPFLQEIYGLKGM